MLVVFNARNHGAKVSILLQPSSCDKILILILLDVFGSSAIMPFILVFVLFISFLFVFRRDTLEAVIHMPSWPIRYSLVFRHDLFYYMLSLSDF